MDIPKWIDWSDENVARYETNKTLYQYTYGVKDIQIKYREFENRSVFVSKPYHIDGNIMEVSLIADEENHLLSSINNAVSKFDTVVEYYISFNENPRYDEWIPILPNGQELVNEYLFTAGTKKGVLRFKCDNTREVTVYKNGVRLSEDFWSLHADNSVAIDKYFDKYAVYTVSYYPDSAVSDPWNIELKNTDRKIVPYIGPDGTEGEVFKNGTDRNGTVTLSKTPYIDYGKINSSYAGYSPVEVVLEQAALAGPNKTVFTTLNKDTVPTTRNVTDYKTLSSVLLKPYDFTLVNNSMTYPYFDFLHQENKVYFTETFNNSGIISNMPTNHGDAWIRIKYNYIKTQFRFKIILRNVSNQTRSITPSVNSYSLVFKVIR